MRVVYSTEDFPASERLVCYREAVSRIAVPIEVRGDLDTEFRVRMEAMDLGPVAVSSMIAADNARMEIHRTSKLIRRSDPEAFRLLLTLRGQTRMIQDDRPALLLPTCMAFYDTSRPFHGWRQSTAGACHLAMLTLPRTLLPLPARTVKTIIGARLPGRQGVGALMVDFVTRLVADADQYTRADATQLATVAVDLMVAVLAHELDVDDNLAVSPESRRRVLMMRIHAFIRQRLGDPDLTPDVIAAAHFISPRLLHKLFHDQGITVAGWIRTCRLERCRADLANPLLRTRPIHLIAAMWGFGDKAHFSRIFRAAYGISPKDWRHQN